MPHRALRQDAPRLCDSGFSLIEIVIAMFVLALMALAVLPLLIGTTKASQSNGSSVAATAFASDRLEAIRADFPLDGDSSSCAAVQAREETDAVDPAGTGLRAKVDVSPSSCPTAFPATVTVTVTVTRPPNTATLAALATEILVTAT